MKEKLISIIPSLLAFFIAFLVVTWFLEGEWRFIQALTFTVVFGVVIFLYNRFIKGK